MESKRHSTNCKDPAIIGIGHQINTTPKTTLLDSLDLSSSVSYNPENHSEHLIDSKATLHSADNSPTI